MFGRNIGRFAVGLQATYIDEFDNSIGAPLLQRGRVLTLFGNFRACVELATWTGTWARLAGKLGYALCG